MADQPPDPQLQSSFITRFPREVRDKVYLELWRSCGLRQHIIWHKDTQDVTKSHFCRWRCTTPFEVEDGLQEAINATRIELGVALGDSFSNKGYALQLYSAWKNHFTCGERIAQVHGSDASPGVNTCSSRGPCWSSPESISGNPVTWSPYLSMLLSCRLMSSECLKSIYESTTFIFTDVIALNMFVGFSKVPKGMKEESRVTTPPPAFRTLGRHLELSLEPVIPMLLACSSPVQTPLVEERHKSPDFHGLRLDLLENLTTLDIWIAARSSALLVDKYADNIDQSPYNISLLNITSLTEALTPLERVKNITLSLPLPETSQPEDGYIVDSAHLRIWRRGSGDRFHPTSSPVFEGEHFNSIVYSTTDRTIQLGCNPPSDERNVHYMRDYDFSPVDRLPPRRGRVARLMGSLRSKGQWLKTATTRS